MQSFYSTSYLHVAHQSYEHLYTLIFSVISLLLLFFFFFFNDTAPPEIYPLSLHDALPICSSACTCSGSATFDIMMICGRAASTPIRSSRPPFCSGLIRTAGIAPALRQSSSVLGDRKSTRLNSSHSQISYAVFCLKKKKIST